MNCLLIDGSTGAQPSRKQSVDLVTLTDFTFPGFFFFNVINVFMIIILDIEIIMVLLTFQIAT